MIDGEIVWWKWDENWYVDRLQKWFKWKEILYGTPSYEANIILKPMLSCGMSSGRNMKQIQHALLTQHIRVFAFGTPRLCLNKLYNLTKSYLRLC